MHSTDTPSEFGDDGFVRCVECGGCTGCRRETCDRCTCDAGPGVTAICDRGGTRHRGPRYTWELDMPCGTRMLALQVCAAHVMHGYMLAFLDGVPRARVRRPEPDRWVGSSRPVERAVAA